MLKQPDISIIIPVYGVEKYIGKCLKSVQNQSFKNFECLVVNDGSPDNSVAVAKESVGADPRFTFLEKENGGLASARNYGLEHAKGHYIAFIDSDDYVNEDFILVPLTILEKEKTDICMMGFNYIDEDGTILSSDYNHLDKYYSQKDFLISKNTVTQFAWSKIYRRDVFDDIRFDENVITYEDAHLNFRLLFGREISNTKQPLYNYLQRSGTLSKDIKPTFIQDRFAISKIQDEFAINHNLVDVYSDYILYTYLKTFVFFTSAKLSRYSKNYYADVNDLKILIDKKKFTLKNIVFMIKKDKKVGLSLLLFKMSPAAYRLLSRFWFRNHIA